MNNARRKEVAKAIALMEEALSILEPCADDENEAYANMPESLQSSERGELSQQWAEALDTAKDGLQEHIDALQCVE